MSCLVLEDDPITGPALVRLLARNGWRAEWATSLDDARERLTAFDPDLLIVDLKLGRGESGLELLRESGVGRRQVILSAAPEPDLEVAAREFPAAQVIRKPAAPEEIIRVVGRGRKGAALT